MPKQIADTNEMIVARFMVAPCALPGAQSRYPRAVGLADDLDRRFDRSVRVALAEPGTRPQAFELRLPPSLRETMVEVGPFEPLARYYCERMPRMLVDQMLRGEDRARGLLWRRLDLSRLPRLDTALRGMFDALGEDGPRLLGARDADELIAQRPTIAALAAPSLLGSGLPLVGAWPAELDLIDSDLSEGKDADEVLDLRLSAAILHELCHGLRRDQREPPAPWIVLEAQSIYLGWLAFPRHTFPRVKGEALPGISLFLLLGQCLARLFGRQALLGVMRGGRLERSFPPLAAQALDAAAREDFEQRREVPFARDALSAPAWVKLADASRAGRRVSLAEAAGLRFDELPWWHEEPAPEDLELARGALLPLCQVNVWTRTYQTHPCEVTEFSLDTRTCLVSRAARSDGVFGEPPSWIYPPPLCRKLRERGAEIVRVKSAEELLEMV